MRHPAFKGQVYVHLLPPDRTMIDGRVVEPGREYKASKRYLFQGKHASYRYGGTSARTPYAFITREIIYYETMTTGILKGVKKGKQPIHCGFGMHALDSGCWKVGWWFGYNNERMEACPEEGRWVCVVRVWGNVNKENNVVVGLRRKVLAMRQLGYGASDLLYEDTSRAIDWVLRKPYNGVVIR